MWKLGLRPRNPRKGIHKWVFPCSAVCALSNDNSLTYTVTFAVHTLDKRDHTCADQSVRVGEGLGGGKGLGGGGKHKLNLW
jgi:hypothetical protein